MEDSWVCGSCRSINQPGSSRCYSCRQSRAGADDLSVASPASDQNRGRNAEGYDHGLPGMRNATVRLVESLSVVRVELRELALAEVVEATDHGPGPLVRLPLRRLPVLIPGLILLVVLVVVLLVAVALDPSLFGKL